MKKILVTGGAGFIGHHLVTKLVEQGNAVVVIDNLSTGSVDNVNQFPITFFQADIRDTEILDKIFSVWRFQEVYHLAALARIQRSWDHPTETYNVNVTGTNNILEMCRKYSVKKVFITSSSSVLAGHSIDVGLKTQQMELSQYAEKLPLNPYAYHKALNEELAVMYKSCWGLDVRAGRPFNVYGEGQNYHSDYSTVIPKFAEQKKKGEKLTIYGDGEQTRDFTYVGDVVAMMIDTMDGNELIYNLCSSDPVSINQVAEAFNHPYEHVDNPRKGEASWTWGENNTGVKPKVNILKWIKQNYA